MVSTERTLSPSRESLVNLSSLGIIILCIPIDETLSPLGGPFNFSGETFIESLSKTGDPVSGVGYGSHLLGVSY